jgi:hypothetical protein
VQTSPHTRGVYGNHYQVFTALTGSANTKANGPQTSWWILHMTRDVTGTGSTPVIPAAHVPTVFPIEATTIDASCHLRQKSQATAPLVTVSMHLKATRSTALQQGASQTRIFRRHAVHSSLTCAAGTLQAGH